LTALASGSADALNAVPGITPAIITAATDASHWAYAHAYRWAWISIIPFVVVGIVCVCLLTDIKHLMTEHVEKSIEKNVKQHHHHHEQHLEQGHGLGHGLGHQHDHAHDNKTQL